MEGEHEHNNTPPSIITPIVETESQLTAPLIDHATRVTRIEERQAQHQEEMIRQLAGLEERMATTASSQVESLRARIADLEGKIAASAEKVGVPDESVELTLPDVEVSPEPPEKMRSGMRHRRKAKRKGGK